MKNSIKSTIRIARIELNSMFYSPVAWLVLVIFAVQVGMNFAAIIDGYLHSKAMGYGLYGTTSGVFSGMRSIFSTMTRNLYLYIPFVTMGLMSREYQSGSIKLLYSSPITNSSIILGKFLSMMIYGFVLCAIMGVVVLFCMVTLENFDLPQVLIGILGIYLLLLAYSAIGLFMSAITAYQVVACMGTLALLAILNFIGEVGQEYAFVRGITYWLSITGRTTDFINGLLSSEDLFYFLIVIAFFLLLSTMKLNSERQRSSLKISILNYSVVALITFAVGAVTSMPSMKVYYDATYTKSNTLAKESQQVMKDLDGALTITTYVNILAPDYYIGLPRAYNDDFSRFEKYVRFKPEIKMKYVYYYDKANNPNLESRYPGLSDQEKAEKLCKVDRLDFDMFLTPEEIKKVIDLSEESNRFVRVVERENGQKAYLRLYNDNQKHPDEAEISAAFKRFTKKAPLVGFLTGHGEREVENYGSRGYYLFGHDRWFRQSLTNQGFDIATIDLSTGEIPQEINTLVISDLKTPLSNEEMEKLNNYIAAGGNLFILADYGRGETMNQLVESLGVRFSDGVVVNRSDYFSPTVVVGNVTAEAAKKWLNFDRLRNFGSKMAMPTSLAIDYSGVKEFEVTPIVVSSSKDSWLERETTDFVDGEFLLNPAAGEIEQSYPLIVTLERKVGEKEQRIILSGDADCISNEELTGGRTGLQASNYSLITGGFRWLSYDEFPINTQRMNPIDNDISLDKSARKWIKWVWIGLFPGIFVFLGVMIMMKRKRK